MGTCFGDAGVFPRVGRAKSAALLALALVFSFGSRALAADLTVTSGSTLNATGASSSVLPQTGSAAPEDSWLSGLHVSGFLSQTFGMW
jgi:hypothetical protein